MAISLHQLQQALPADGLFGGGAWRWSPEPLRLSRGEVRAMTSLGHPLARFQQACDTLYRRSAHGSLAPWLAALLDAGKPAWLIEAQRSTGAVGQLPRVIRPDLILRRDGFSLTELDSVPGGMGITAWLSKTYASAGFEVLGGADGMLEGFRTLLPDGGDILISREAADYGPEMRWLCRELGEDWRVLAAEDAAPGERRAYRFFELFDWQNIPAARAMAEAAAAGRYTITPPFKPHLEDKLWLALLWSPALRGFWQATLRDSHLKRIREITPFGWVVDPAPLPPHAALPRLDAHSWQEVASLSQKERHLVLKISGFHETAWGSRGVHIGHDLPAAEWAERIAEALTAFQTQPWLMQEFHEGRLIEHPVFRNDGSVESVMCRARLCPYYFTNDQGVTRFSGCLATLVPADKKKIHGMQDGILVPCVLDPA